MEFIGDYFDLLLMPSIIISNVFDPHPNTVARMNNQADYIQKELISKETNPKMKKELQKQLNEINKILDKWVEAEDDGFFFTYQYDKLMLMFFGGDIRNGMAKGMNEEFDEAERRAEAQLKEINSKKKR